MHKQWHPETLRKLTVSWISGLNRCKSHHLVWRRHVCMHLLEKLGSRPFLRIAKMLGDSSALFGPNSDRWTMQIKGQMMSPWQKGWYISMPEILKTSLQSHGDSKSLKTTKKYFTTTLIAAPWNNNWITDQPMKKVVIFTLENQNCSGWGHCQKTLPKFRGPVFYIQEKHVVETSLRIATKKLVVNCNVENKSSATWERVVQQVGWRCPKKWYGKHWKTQNVQCETSKF